jgi:hypothetical protein
MMTPAELDAISHALLPGKSKNKRADYVSGLVGYGRRQYYNWSTGESDIHDLVAMQLRLAHSKAMKRSVTKDAK